MTPEQFIEWIDREIQHSEWIKNQMTSDSQRYNRASDGIAIFTKVKEKFLTLTPPPTTLS
jgi:hypothetical protein